MSILKSGDRRLGRHKGVDYLRCGPKDYQVSPHLPPSRLWDGRRLFPADFDALFVGIQSYFGKRESGVFSILSLLLPSCHLQTHTYHFYDASVTDHSIFMNQ